MCLFEKYDNNRAIIFSVFEGQYDGCVYIDDRDIDDLQWAVLRTPFLQHFIAGKPTAGCPVVLEDILFNTILREQNDNEKEIAVFSDSDEWSDILQGIFRKRNGVSDSRKIFEFSPENFIMVKRPSLSADIQAVAEKCRNSPDSRKDAWSVKLFSGDKLVSHCDALMVGRGMAEINISTEEVFRGKGYATLAAILLIDKLLGDGLTPTWSTCASTPVTMPTAAATR
jgi:hypothetical protein